MINLLLGCGPSPIHPQHLVMMEKIAPTADFDEWVLIDKYVHEAGILNYDALNLPYKDGEIDNIYTSHLLEHFSLKEAQSALVEWKRVLKEGGRLVINVPDMEWAAQAILALCDRKHPNLGNDKIDSDLFNTLEMLMEVIYGNQDHEGEFHKSGYTVSIIENMFKKVGLKCDSIIREYEAHKMGCLIARATK